MFGNVHSQAAVEVENLLKFHINQIKSVIYAY